jgi:outer membrane lipoprotein LolB
LVGNQGQASLTLPSQEPVHAPSAEYLMAHYLGWQFPVLDIRYWVKGQASPHSQATEVRDEMGLLESLQQHDWQIEFSHYQLQSGTWLPSRIKMIGHQFKFIFAIKEWTING